MIRIVLRTLSILILLSANLGPSHGGGTLSNLTVREFANGYWYVDELREFAGRIGIPVATRLRKDAVERAIVAFLRR